MTAPLAPQIREAIMNTRAGSIAEVRLGRQASWRQSSVRPDIGTMQITVVFEHWHLGDGNYPACSVGDEARLSFELSAASVEPVSEAVAESVRQVHDADYEIAEASSATIRMEMWGRRQSGC
jgi:hypothetical protein